MQTSWFHDLRLVFLHDCHEFSMCIHALSVPRTSVVSNVTHFARIYAERTSVKSAQWRSSHATELKILCITKLNYKIKIKYRIFYSLVFSRQLWWKQRNRWQKPHFQIGWLFLLFTTRQGVRSVTAMYQQRSILPRIDLSSVYLDSSLATVWLTCCSIACNV